MDVYAIKVTLLGTSPPVWRRVLVQRDITLRNLHKTLQTVMGWTNSHLHQFVFKRQRYSDPKHGLGAGIIDENRTRLGDVICTPGTRLLYEYDGTVRTLPTPVPQVSVCDSHHRMLQEIVEYL